MAECDTIASIQRKLARIEGWIEKLFKGQNELWKQGKQIMAKIDDLIAGLNDEAKAIDDLAAAVAGGVLDQSKVDAALGIVQSNKAKLTALQASLSPPPPAPTP
jgi:uncharacterized protein YoxC